MGVLNLDKPAGLTSHDVITRLRRITGLRRIGHAGTLDPLATGVLVVCLGKATRLVEYLADSDKIYRATVRLGLTTDTWDGEGDVVTEADISHLTLPQIEEALPAFRGEIQQVPPMYSALKHEGKPLYKLARKGLSIERDARTIQVYRLDVVSWQPPDLVIEVHCSKGTYVRALAHDLGQALGVGAYLYDLVRTAVGPFRLEQAVPLYTLADASWDWQRYLIPLAQALEGLPQVTVDAEAVQRILTGQQIALPPHVVPPTCCALDGDGEVLAMLQFDADTGAWQPNKVLARP
jgi:tRNA pseudouridine55 synthase